MKIVWRKHNLIISSSVGSGHPGKYSYDIPHDYLKGWGNLSGKIISVKRNHSSNLVSFFSNSNSPPTPTSPLPPHTHTPSHVLPLFQNNFILGEATSSHFFRVTTLTQHLLFRNRYFSRTAAFLSQAQNKWFVLKETPVYKRGVRKSARPRYE